MNDEKLIDFFNFFCEEIFEGTMSDPEELKQNLPGSLKQHAVFNQADDMDEDQLGKAMGKEEAISFSKKVVELWSDDFKLNLLLNAVLNEYDKYDEETETEIPVGSALSILLISASNEVIIQVGKTRVDVNRKSPDATNTIEKTILELLNSNVFQF